MTANILAQLLKNEMPNISNHTKKEQYDTKNSNFLN